YLQETAPKMSTPKELTPKGKLLYDALRSNPQESMAMLRAVMLSEDPTQRDAVERAVLGPAEALLAADVAGVGPSSRMFITSAVASVFMDCIEKTRVAIAARRAQAAAAPAAPPRNVPTTRRASTRRIKEEEHHSASADVNDVLHGEQMKEKRTERRK
ncbi:hypothetical protein PRIPAC_84147, partial [Pristionchus pacificus]|uniref:Uncharacterized protein n=1 Tax=Pristionchus pacificus TaxID=54126 RepID=A0A2A6BSC5_PRIPA